MYEFNQVRKVHIIGKGNMLICSPSKEVPKSTLAGMVIKIDGDKFYCISAENTSSTTEMWDTDKILGLMVRDLEEGEDVEKDPESKKPARRKKKNKAAAVED